MAEILEKVEMVAKVVKVRASIELYIWSESLWGSQLVVVNEAS